MAESSLASRSALAGLLVPGRYGYSAPGITIEERRGLAIAHATARSGRRATLVVRFAAQFGVTLPDAGHWAACGGLAAHAVGPEQWLVVEEETAGHDLTARLSSGLAGLASVCDYSDMFAVLRVSGLSAREALAKGVPIDLHPRAFGSRRTASTLVHHIGVQIWQADDTPSFDIALARGFAGSFWDWLTASASEFGFEVIP